MYQVHDDNTGQHIASTATLHDAIEVVIGRHQHFLRQLRTNGEGATHAKLATHITDATIGQQVLAYAHSPANRTTTADEADIAWDLRHGIYSG
jgi:hypothetical protein